MNLFAFTSNVVTLGLWILLVAVKSYALIDALRRPRQAFDYVGKQPKNLWLIILGISAMAQFISSPLAFWNLLGLVAALVYLFGIRPDLQQYGGGTGGGSGGNGPYGSW